jgi:hypothetical protein
MAEVELSSSKYFQQAEQARAEAAGAAPPPPPQPPKKKGGWENAASYTSVIAGAAALICVVAIAIPIINSAASHRPKNAIDMMLRFGGAKEDETFEKFLKNTVEATQRDFEEQFRNSPGFEFNPDKFRAALDDMNFDNWESNSNQRGGSRSRR